jgi:HPt (histidine-containing phosphotransfer) domain-containing protein
LAEAFLEMIKTTQAGVGRDGNVSRPTLFLNDPSFIEKLQHELIERGPEFQKQIEIARNEQDQQALAREVERLARYDNLE